MSATNKSIGTIVFYGVLTLIILVNAVFTFLFGGRYGAETFPTTLPTLSFVLGGLMHLAFYDLASAGWFYAREQENTSTQQRALATILAAASMLASTAVSAIQLALTTTLVDLSAAHGWIGLAALIMMIVLAATHFFGVFAWRMLDPSYRQMDIELETKARLATFRNQQKERVIVRALEKVKARADEELDTIADMEAAQLWQAARNTLQIGSSARDVVDADSGGKYSIWSDGEETFTDGNLDRARRVAAAMARAGAHVQIKQRDQVIEDYGTPRPQPASNGSAGKA